MKRLKKFNGGLGAILCNGCRVILKSGFGCRPNQISEEDWQSNKPIFCKRCEQRSIKPLEQKSC